MSFKVKFADLVIEIEATYSYVKQFCKKYLSPDYEESVFEIQALQAEIEAENTEISGKEFSPSYLETLAILRKIAETFPLYHRMLMHGAVISYEEKAYMFTALSGTGKTTHIRLWNSYLGENVQIVNGDKPFLWIKDSEVMVYGNPWAGKEHWHKNCYAPLKGLVFLVRGTENCIRKIDSGSCLKYLMKQIYLPKDKFAAEKTLELLDQMLRIVPLYVLECDMSEKAVKVSFEMLTGLCYETCRLSKENEEDSYAN